MGQFEFKLWLAHWYSQREYFEFDWDVANAFKSWTKHGVSSREIEEIFVLKTAMPLGLQISPEVNEDRFCVVGPTRDGRMVSIVFTLRVGKIRPISARPASRKERASYEKIRKALEGIR